MKKIFLLIIAFLSVGAHTQGIMDSLTTDISSETTDSTLITENIESIAASHKIFIISNSNNSYAKGDFISLIFQSQLVARALVAKITDNRAGIKIVKIYSEDQWRQLKKGRQIQILRGDDSYYQASLKGESKTNDQEEASTLMDEDDLFDETTFADGDLEVSDNAKRIIKPDNLFGANFGAISISTTTAQAQFHMTASWAYQISDNFWIEGVLGRSGIADFPGDGIDTEYYTLTGRIKYTFKAPFYSYFQPYVGLQYHHPISPGAGQGVNISEAQAEEELNKLESLRQVKAAMGITILKRLVPGWFLRGDFGTDGMYAGLSLEF